MLVRRFIGKRLADYYAQPSHKVVGRSTTELDDNRLSSLLGEWHWKSFFGKIYKEREGHWLTPVELFQPHYSYVLGDFCAKYHDLSTSNSKNNNNNTSLEIVELGGGRGTNAHWILSYLKEQKPHVYNALTSYTLVDSSPSLHKAQFQVFQNGPFAEKVRFELKDLTDVAQGTTKLLSSSDVPTVVMGMEVLDNLPHDKIRGKMRHKLEQAEVVQKSQRYKEKFIPLSDPLLKKILRTVPQYSTQQGCSWVPSVACGVLGHVLKQRPNAGVVMADFDWLPDPELTTPVSTVETPAVGAPIVTDMEGVDHESYLTSPRHCDILFPTDFDKLATFCRKTLRRNDVQVQVLKQSEFLEHWGPEHVKNTKSWLSGHTPLLHDFSNCSVLTIHPKV